MAGRKDFNQNRRDAMYWAEEWKIKQRRKRIFMIAGVIAAAAIIWYAIDCISVMGSRMTFSSEEEMRAAIQGRYTANDYEDIFIDGDDVKLVYYDPSHYDIGFAERNGYSEYGDSVYEDKVEKWDYRKGVIKCGWMDEITVDREGRLVYYSQEFTATDEPHPEPFDPSLLGNDQEDPGEAEPEQEDPEIPEELEEQQKSLEDTQGAAEDAGVFPDEESNEV